MKVTFIYHQCCIVWAKPFTVSQGKILIQTYVVCYYPKFYWERLRKITKPVNQDSNPPCSDAVCNGRLGPLCRKTLYQCWRNFSTGRAQIVCKILKKSFRVPITILKSKIWSWSLPKIIINCIIIIINTYNYIILTPWSRVLLEKLTGSAASQEIPRIFGTRRFLTVPTSARHLYLS